MLDVLPRVIALPLYLSLLLLRIHLRFLHDISSAFLLDIGNSIALLEVPEA